MTALALATQALGAIKDRNLSDPSVVDDVVLGCVDPVGEAGGDIARAAALTAGYGNTVAGVQINRFCASGLDAINFASAQVMSGQHDMTIGGGVESMSRVGMGASGGAWPMDPAIAIPTYFLPQGISAESSRQIRFVTTSTPRGREPKRSKAVDSGNFTNTVIAVKDYGITPRQDEHSAHTTMQSLGSCRLVRADGRDLRLRRVR